MKIEQVYQDLKICVQERFTDEHELSRWRRRLPPLPFLIRGFSSSQLQIRAPNPWQGALTDLPWVWMDICASYQLSLYHIHQMTSNVVNANMHMSTQQCLWGHQNQPCKVNVLARQQQQDQDDTVWPDSWLATYRSRPNQLENCERLSSGPYSYYSALVPAWDYLIEYENITSQQQPTTGTF